MTSSLQPVSRNLLLLLALSLVLFAASCSNETKAEPTKATVTLDPNVFTVEHPELFKLTAVEARKLPIILKSNGAITPDVNRTIHVTSLGSGRVVDLKVRLGDYVEKGQVLLVISSTDLGLATGDYQKAHADEEIAHKALDRAQLLNSHGALAEKDLQLAQGTEEKAKVDLQTAEQRIHLLGGDPAHPSPLIQLRAPVSGTIVEQNVAGFEGVKSLDNSPTLFTIADLSQVWAVCDVYENDLNSVRVGDEAEIKLNAYPDKAYRGKVVDISRVLDPSTRSAKARIVLQNPDGALRPGMYAAVTFHSKKLEPRLLVPSGAIMRLQDKDWLFQKEGDRFRRVEARVLGTTADGMEEIECPAKAGDPVIANALEFSTAASEQGK